MDIIPVTAAVILKNKKVLITRRKEDGRHPGKWEFPGGKVEPGESPRECIAREIKEEIGVAVLVGEKIVEINHRYDDMEILLIAYTCEIDSGIARNLGCSDHAWVSPEEVFRFDLLPPDLKIAAVLCRTSELRMPSE